MEWALLLLIFWIIWNLHNLKKAAERTAHRSGEIQENLKQADGWSRGRTLEALECLKAIERALDDIRAEHRKLLHEISDARRAVMDESTDPRPWGSPRPL